jgi:Ca-activated chloride channel family protein
MLRARLVLALFLLGVSLWMLGCGENGPAGITRPAPAAKSASPADELGSARYTQPAEAAAGTTVQVPAALDDAAVSSAEGRGPGDGGDKHAHLAASEFLVTRDAPLSTFSIDVDTASYSKTRAYLLDHHRLPPADAVRIEELINYFRYDYAGPTDDHPFAVHLETAECPWQPKHRLVCVGIQGKRLGGERPQSNLVFLIDVSGSMNEPNKLPLVQRSLSRLVRELGASDRVSIVVYAGASGLVLPPTSGADQNKILAAIDNLQAGGSTNGGAGIRLAYATAREQFLKHGTNRVLLCTDGDFNVGVTSTGELVRLASEEAKSGVYLSVLGFGFGNHNDALLEELSNKANGNYAFIDSDAEGQKVLVEQMQGTLVTIAKDVKLQVEFNPGTVAAYRLIGYENRRLADQDFNDDTKDAGDIGAGHSVTALYELVPAGIESPLAKAGVDPLKYQEPDVGNALRGVPEAVQSELLTLKLRYQPPTGGQSTLLTFPLKDSGSKFNSASADTQFAAAVASFGMLLRQSKFKGNATFASVVETAAAARGEDQHGLRAEFLELVQAAQRLSGEPVSVIPAHAGRRESIAVYSPRLPATRVFLIGIAAGIGASFVALVIGVKIASWYVRWSLAADVSEKFANPKFIPGK